MKDDELFDLKKYIMELKEILKKESVKELRDFMWKYKDIYEFEIPSDQLLEITMYKMIVENVDMPKRLKKKAREW